VCNEPSSRRCAGSGYYFEGRFASVVNINDVLSYATILVRVDGCNQFWTF